MRSLVHRHVDVEKIIKLATSPAGITPLAGPPKHVSKNARKRARRKQRKWLDRPGGSLVGVEAGPPDGARVTENNDGIDADQMYRPRPDSDTSSEMSSCPTTPSEVGTSCRIAVARDSAFCFYYEVREVICWSVDLLIL